MADLDFILEQPEPGRFELYACRGAGKGCNRNKFRRRKAHCDDCVHADDPKETLEAFQARMRRGDA